MTINVTSVNDAPSFSRAGCHGARGQRPAHREPWATAISPGDADESGQTLTFNVTNNTNPALFAGGGLPAVSDDRDVDVHARGERVRHGHDHADALDDNGGTANGGDDTSPTQTFVITVTGVNDAPSFTVGAESDRQRGCHRASR